MTKAMQILFMPLKVMGLEYGRMLSFLYVELRGMIAYAYELRIAEDDSAYGAFC